MRAPWLIRLLAAGALAGAAACPGPGDDAGSDASPTGPDAPPGPGGLTIRFVPEPAIPADLGGAHETGVAGLALVLEDVRAVGDSSPGGEQTYRAVVPLEWDEEGSPPALVFATAPLGRYSRLEARLATFAAAGSVTVEATPMTFEVEDGPPAPIAVAVPLDDATVEAGATRELAIAIDLAAVLLPIDWSQVEAEDDELHLGPEDAEILPLRARLAGAFRLASSTLVPNP